MVLEIIAHVDKKAITLLLLHFDGCGLVERDAQTLGCLYDCIGVSNRTLNNGLASRAASKSHPLHLRNTSLSVQTRHWKYKVYELGPTTGETYCIP